MQSRVPLGPGKFHVVVLVLKYSLLLSPSQRVYLWAITFYPPPLPDGHLSDRHLFYVFSFTSPGRLFRPLTFAENDNLITADIVNN